MKIVPLLALCLFVFYPLSSQAQGTSFTYQGRLVENGASANGVYDLRFNLFGASAGGSALTAAVDQGDVALTNGLFTVTLDFGAATFDGSARWLEIAVRPGASTGAYTNLSPRQALTATPYALRAANFS